MPLDPMIARGVAPIDVSNTLAQISALRQRDQGLQQDQAANTLMRERFTYGQQQDAREQAQLDEDDREWDAAYQARDWGSMARLDPQTTKVLWDYEQAQKPPDPLTVQDFPGVGTGIVQGGEIKQFRNAPQPQQYGPESFSPQTLEDGSIVLVGNRGTTRRTEFRGAVKADPAEVEAKTKKASANTSWNMYTAAMEGVRRSMVNTTTGPVLGRLPAFSGAQQTADGAVAAIAPVLKQLFRTAGEGTFTDKDQQLLLAMVPTRADRPEARDAKIANIDAIVRAKLGIEPETSSGSGGLTPEEKAELESLRQRLKVK